MLRLGFLLCAFLACAACSEPPQKEIDRAQGAIDAARAAGAEQYASEPFGAATTALQQAHEAVEQRDYRQALSHALEASERAQEAARNAADGKAAARSRSETALKSTTTLLQQLETRINAAEAARIPARDLRPVTSGAATAAAALQEARATMQAGKYLDASDALAKIHGEIEAQIRALDEMLQARATKRPRARSPRG